MEGYEGASSSESVLDLSRLNLNNNSLDTVSEKRRKDTKQLYLCYNRLTVLPESISLFSNLEFLDISNNTLSVICEDITRLTKLKTLIAKNNRLNDFSLPKHFGSLQLEVLNFSGNRFEEMPSQCLQLLRLQSLSLGGNRLKSIPAEIESLTSLELLYLGGNQISSIPAELANLPCLSYLVLCDNRIQMHNTLLLNSLLNFVHNNVINIIIFGVNRPLVNANRFLTTAYLTTSFPGVYFDSCVRHIKFVDFCGKYRLPLMHYLCSPECTSPCSSNPQSDADSDEDNSVPADRLQRVLLGQAVVPKRYNFKPLFSVCFINSISLVSSHVSYTLRLNQY
uniref:Leucine rich repeat containing 58b n=1 Tax=Sinocyclocheilus rhinocerous TaxID=307959 RepID=A0A673JH28_9TELE